MNEKIEALEKEVKFLRELVLELSKKQVVVQPPTVYPNPITPQPYNPYPPYPTGPYYIGDPIYKPYSISITDGAC
jgi:hypothetical protein